MWWRLLADDKKKLSERCEQLVTQLKRTDEQYSGALRRLEEEHTTVVKRSESSHAAELARLQELHAASEKLRREKWVEEKSARIRELTVRGLEPEIQALVAKHREEVARLKALHEQELLAADEKAGSRYLRMVRTSVRNMCLLTAYRMPPARASHSVLRCLAQASCASVARTAVLRYMLHIVLLRV